MDLGPVIDRIRAQCPSYAVVDFSASFEALKGSGVPALPASFVLPGKETAARNKNAGGLHQLVRFRFRVYHLVRYAGDALGADAMDILEPVRQEMRNALFNWRLPDPPDPGAGNVVTKPDGPIEFGEADFVQFVDGVLVFYDQLEFDGYYRRVT